MNRPRGRPNRAEAPASREEMVTTALELLDQKGVEAFTMRALADRLKVNPMTIHHHFGGRDGLIGAMSEWSYADVSPPEGGAPTERISGLLQAYHAQVLRHPGLTKFIFSRPSVFPEQARRITEEISALLTEAGLSAGKTRLWIDILVDFTHGAALATAMSQAAEADQRAEASRYDAALEELLKAFPE